MDTLLYLTGIAFVRFIQLFPLRVVARIGRAGGAVAWFLDGRHRRVALQNLTMVFSTEKSPEEIKAIGKENFRRLGENYLAAVKTASMTAEQLKPHVEFIGIERLPHSTPAAPINTVVALGHFGNFELYARFNTTRPDWQGAATYRALKQPGLNRVLLSLRNRSGCIFFERRTDGPLLRAAMSRGGLLLGLMADQNAKGFRGLFLGHDCNTSTAPAVFALRYNTELFTGACYRVALGKWRLELGEKITTHENGHARASEEIMRDVNKALETAIRRDPANWFWVHRRWKD